VGHILADRYLIQKKLGEGGMGQVYLAEHVKMGRRCAIKIMTPGTMNDPDAISRFNREAANASRISHANVCQIYDFGETSDGLIYLAMEFIEGRSLTALLEESPVLSLPRAAALIAQCAEALQAAHDLGIVHRDLKPDNIMVITARGKDTVKVVDFGIAKAMGQEGTAQKVTKTGFVVGTPEYMSPEQLAGDPVDGRSDIYSLALVLYRAVTGKLPFAADTAQETMIKRLTDEPLPLAAARPDLRFPPGLQRVMDRALARSPDSRYRGAAEFGREVTAASGGPAQTGVDLEAGTQMVSSPSPRTVPQTRIDPAVAAELERKKPVGRPEPRAPAPVRQKGPPAALIAGGVLLLAAAGAGAAFRHQIFGASSGPDTVRAPVGGGKVTTLSHPTDSTKAPPVSGQTAGDSGKAASPGGASDAQRSAPPPTRDTAGRARSAVRPSPSPSETRGGKADAALPPVEALFEAATRGPARVAAESVFHRSDVRDSVRAAAAAYLASSYVEEKQFDRARFWIDSAIALAPGRSEYQTLRQGIIKAIGN
jgi:serine/threonine-protein kinase